MSDRPQGDLGRSRGTHSGGSWVTAVSNPFPAQPWLHAGGKRDVLLLQAGRPQLRICSGGRGSALGRGTCHRQPTEQLAGLRRGMRASLTAPGRRAPTAPHAAGLLPTVQAAGFSPEVQGRCKWQSILPTAGQPALATDLDPSPQRAGGPLQLLLRFVRRP